MDLNKARSSWGYRVWWRDVMMAFEMHVHAALIVAAVWLIVFVLLSWIS